MITQKIEYNPPYYPLFNSEIRVKRLQGGAGSGKSIAVAQHILNRIISQKGHRAFCFRKVGRTVRNSIFQTFIDIISEIGGARDSFKFNKTEFSITYIPNGNFIACGGMDDREKVKSIKDPTIIWMEEATEFQREDFQQLNLRLRKKGIINEIILSYNPVSKANWIYKDFDVENQYPAHFYLKTTHRDNYFLPKEYRDELARLEGIDINYYKIYCLGEWGEVIKGRIYDNVEIIDEFPETERHVYGLDFGFSDPMAMSKILVDPDARRVYIDEIFYESGCTTSQLIERMPSLGITSSDLIYCDSANPDKIVEISNSGFYGAREAKKGPGSINAGIDFLKGFTLCVTRSSVNVLKEVELYKWAEDRDGNFLDKPIDKFNHALDSIRYAAFTHWHIPPTEINLDAWLNP